MFVFKLLFLFLFFGHGALGLISSKELEGYAEGYLANCPGSTKPAIITPKSLNRLGFMVVGGNGTKQAYRRFYNYYEAKEISKDKYLDFKSKKTVVFFGGYVGVTTFRFSGYLSEIYRRLGYNVLLMEINKFLTVEYPVVPRFLPPIGKHLAEMLTNMTADGLDPKSLEFVGLSIGAHAMSFVAKGFKELTGRNVSKLTGLDPIGLCFRNRGPEGRLDESDGDFVQVLHTNIDGFGMAAPIGHVDFYVNGGESQPSEMYWMPCNVMCSHFKAYSLWYSVLESPNYFIGLKCDSVQQARRHQCYDRVPLETNVISNTKTNMSNTGIFYVATENNFPYYMGSKGLKKENNFWTKHMLDWNKEEVIRIF